MNDELGIRDALGRRLDAIDGDSELPRKTLQRAKRRRTRMMSAVSIGVVASVMLVFVGTRSLDDGRPSVELAPVTTPTPEEPSPQSDTEPDKNEPPLVTVTSSDQSAQLSAWSYCFGNGCINGAPPPKPPDVGSPNEVFVEFPLDDWSFDAYFTPSGERCGRVQQAPVEETQDGRFLLRPAGYADAYDVTLFGRGDGSLSVTFRWTTPTDGPLPEPEARVAVLAGNPRNPDSYGIELGLDNLAETPEKASATITVSAEQGGSLTFEAKQARSRCLEGSLYWDGPDDMGRRATELGEGPFRYRVEVILDGKRYTAEAVWPDDEIKGNEPSVSLDFIPALPALR